MQRARTCFALLALTSVFLIWCPDPAVAQMGDEIARGGFGLTPLEITVQATPGGEYSREINIGSEGLDREQELAVEVHDVGQLSNGQLGTADQGEGARSCAEWLDTPRRVTLPPDDRITVPIELAVPADASGAYYAFIVVRAAPGETTSTMATSLRVGARALVTVQIQGASSHVGMEVSGLQLKANETAPPDAIVTVANTGQWRLSVDGDLQLRAPGRMFPIRVPLPAMRSGRAFEVYPGASVNMICPLPTTPPAGTYDAQVRALLGPGMKMQADYTLEVPEGDWEEVEGEFVSEAGFKLRLDVEPSVVDLNLPAGATRTVPIRVRNQGDQDVRIVCDPVLARIEPDGLMTYTAEWPADREKWIEVQTPQFDLQPRAASAVRMVAKIPREHPDQSTAVAALRVTGYALDENGEIDPETVGEYPVLIMARAPRAPEADLEGVGIVLIRAREEGNPMTAVARVRNTGGQIGQIAGTVRLEDAQNQPVATLTVGRDRDQLILPGGEREFRLPLPPLDAGEYTVTAELEAAGGAGAPAQMSETFAVTTAIPETLQAGGNDG